MSRGPYPFEPRASFAAPVIGLPGPANAYEPRPVLCIQPMTAADARYAEGRRAGLLAATAAVEEALDGDECDCAMGMPLGTDIRRLPSSARCTPCRVRDALALAGES